MTASDIGFDRRRVTRRDWYVGVCLLALALILHALVPRYEIRHPGGDDAQFMLRVDRWTGEAKWVRPQSVYQP